MLLRIALRWASLVLASPLLLAQAQHAATAPNCVPLTANFDVTASVKICPGTYAFDDPENDGVIRVLASNVFIDLEGVTIAGSQMQGFGIRADGVDGVIMRGASIRGFKAAVYLSDGDGHRVERCDLSHNKKRPVTHSPGDFLAVWPDLPGQFNADQIGNGVLLSSVTHSVVRKNSCNDQQNGIGIFQCSNLEIVQNDCDDNEGWGLHVHRSSNNVIAQNSADNNFNKVSTYCHDVQQDGCDTAALLLIKDSNDNLVIANSLRNSGDGVFSAAQESATHWGADRNRYEANDCSFAKHIGLESTFSDENIFVRNVASQCGRYGFWLGYSTNAVVRANRIEGNAFAGISNESVVNELIEDNAILGNRIGIELRRGTFGLLDQDSRDHLIRHNRIADSLDLGLSIVDSHAVVIEENTIADNAAGNLRFGSALEADIEGPLAVNRCNVLGLALPFNVKNTQAEPVDLTDNWWGTTDPDAIAASIEGQDQYAQLPPHRIPRIEITYMLGSEGPHVLKRVVNERAGDALDGFDSTLPGLGNAPGVLNLGREPGTLFGSFVCGLRFSDVYVPAGATLLSAVIVLPVDGPDADALDLSISGVASDSAPRFEETTMPLALPRTLASVAWVVDDVWSANGWASTPDVTAIVEELLARPGWQSGNALGFLIDDTGMSAGYRSAWSFDREGYAALPGTPFEFRRYRKFRFTKLEIEYDLYGSAMVVEREHSSGADDADFCVGCNEVHLGNQGGNVTGGFRFPGVALPRTAPLAGARLWLATDGTYTNTLTVRAYGERLANAPPYSGGSLPASRPKTTAFVPWTISNTWNFLEWHATPDLIPLIEEVVAQAGWSSGNAIAIDVSNAGSSGHRRVWGFDRDPRVSDHDFPEIGATPFVPFRDEPVVY